MMDIMPSINKERRGMSRINWNRIRTYDMQRAARDQERLERALMRVAGVRPNSTKWKSAKPASPVRHIVRNGLPVEPERLPVIEAVRRWVTPSS
jgi:hypothetical protein